MPNLSVTELGANGVSHDWNHVLQVINDVKTWANTTKLDYGNMQDNGLRADNLRTHSRVEVGRIYVHNNSGGTISLNDICYFTGTATVSSVNIPTIGKAISTAALATNFPGMCIATGAIANAGEGTVARAYEVTGLNTSGGTVGYPVYLNTTAGQWTLTRPTGGQFVQVVGFVTVVHASTGRIVLAPGPIEEHLFGAAGGLGIWLDADHDSGIHATADGVVKLKIEGTDRWESDTSGHWMPTSDGGVNIGQTAKRVGTVFTSALEIKTTDAAAGSVKNILELEWDPSDDSNLTDNTSGVGIDFTMPEDDDTQSIYARIAGMVANDAANAWGGILRFSVADDADGSLDPAVDIDIASMRPYTSDKLALGDANQMWADLFLADGGVLNFNNGNVTVTHASGALTNSGTLTNTGLVTATAGITSGSAIKSDTDSTDDLGTTSVRWANIYTDNIGDTGQDLTVLATTVNLPSGTVLDFNSANVTVTHSSGKLALAGGLDIGVNDTGYDVKFFGATASKFWEWDESEDQMNVAGSVDVNGSTQLDGTLTVGVDGTGYDVKLFGDTAGKYALWDESADTLLFPDSTPITMGTGSDATIQFDATNLVYNTAGYHSFTGGDLHVGNGQGVVIGHTAQVTSAGVVPELQILGTTHGVDGSMILGTYSTSNTAQSTLQFVKSCQATFGALDHDTRPADTEGVGQISWQVDDGENLDHACCMMRVTMDGSPGADSVPGRWSIWVTTGGANTPVEKLRVNSGGNTYTNDGTVNSLSDITSKKDVANFTDGLAVINRLRPIKFKYNGKYGMGADDGVERVGFSAQEVQEVAPYLVDQSSENTNKSSDINAPETRVPVLGMSQGRLIPVMVNAFKEVEARLAALEAA